MNKYIGYIKTFKKYNYLLSLLVKSNIEKKYKDSALGIIWSLLNPLLQMGVLTLIFSALFKRDIENYALYLIIARLMYDIFSSSTNASLKSLVNAGALLKKINFPKYMVPLSAVISNFIIFLISLIDLILVMVISGVSLTTASLLFPLYLIMYFVFITGISFILSILNTFFRDVEHFYGVFLMLLMYGCAIFYPASIVPEQYQIIFTINPVYQFIEAARSILYYGAIPTMSNFILCAIYSATSIIMGMVVFERYQDRVIMKL